MKLEILLSTPKTLISLLDSSLAWDISANGPIVYIILDLLI